MARVLTKKSTVPGKVPLAADLEIGELAVNTADAKLYTKHSDNTIKQLGGDAASGYFRTEPITATASGQTSFTVPGGYTPGAIFVSLNGATLPPADFTATNGTTVVLESGNGIVLGSVLLVYVLSTFEVADALPLGGTAADSSKLGGRAAADYEALYGRAGTAGALGFRNKIINGGCQIAQRGGVAAVPGVATYGGCDRIPVAPLSFSTCSGTILRAGGPGNPISETGYAQSIQGLTTTGSGSVWFTQKIEAMNSADLNGKKITFSCRVQHDIGTTVPVHISLYKANSPDSFSSATLIAQNTTFSVANGQTKDLVWTVQLGVSDASNGLQVNVQVGGISGVGAVTGRSIYVANLQLEAGEVATPFEHRPYGTELALCQRYYETGTSTTPGHSFATHWFKVTKRVIPTMGADGGATPVAISGDKFRTDDGALVGDFNFVASAEI